MSIEIIPTGVALGAEISGIDLAQPIDDATFATIERAYNDHGVIFFRDHHITPAQQVAFTRRFGDIELNIFGERWSIPGRPEIVVVSNVVSAYIVMRDDCVGIDGLNQEEAEALIAALADHIVEPGFIYRHQWRRGDLLM
jgi:alpha-ketoglutarate-dependent taurine dioxygenase